MKKKIWLCIGTGILILILAVWYCFNFYALNPKEHVKTESMKTMEQSKETSKVTASPKNSKEASKTKEPSSGVDASGEAKTCTVYICGEVKHPGVYELPFGERVAQVVDLAGGFTKKANEEFWNLAELITDGQQITIPSKASKKDIKNSSCQEKPEGPMSTASSNEATVINLNKASKEQLMTLPGIGEAKADAILRYREEQGAFQKPEDIMQIEGIKEGVFNGLKDYVIVEQ